MGALPPNRGARSDLPGRGVRCRHHSLKRRLRALRGTTASLTVSVDGPGDQREHATRVHARGYTASRDHPSEDHTRGRGGVLLPKRLTERLTKCLANGSVNGLTIRSAERLSGCLCECYRQCFFRIPFTLVLCYKAWKPLLRRARLPDIRFHDLRHTCATLLLTKGVHPKVVSELLGHSSIAITLDTYSHVIPGLGDAAASAMEDAFRG